MNKRTTFWGRNEDDESLVVQIMEGVKTATCTPKVWADAETEEQSDVGDLFDVYTKKGRLTCTIKITEVYEIPFGEITGDIGERIAKGENSTLQEFIDDHIFCWKEPLEQEGHGLNERTVIVVEHFELVENHIDLKEFQ